MAIPQWLDWAQRLQSIAQTGLHYNGSPYDHLRYQDVLEIAAEMIAANGATDVRAADDLSALKAILLLDKGHTTPKIDVRGAVFHEGKLLLVQEKADGDRWTLPGGWADVGESAGESVVREIYEETGYHARALKLMALFDRNKHDHPPYPFHAYKAFFRCELTRLEREPDPRNVETGNVGWFTLDEIGALPLSVARVTFSQYARFFEHLAEPDLATDFD